MRRPAAQVHLIWRRAVDDALVALLRDAAERACMPLEALTGRARHGAIIRVRAAVVWAARVSLRASYPDIARVMGRDHTSIVSLARRADVFAARDPAFRQLCTRLARTRSNQS